MACCNEFAKWFQLSIWNFDAMVITEELNSVAIHRLSDGHFAFMIENLI
jgi:hypothetical protein